MISGFVDLSINQTIKKLRELRNITQQEIANMLNMSLYSYAKLEYEETIRAQLILDIAHILNVCPQLICYKKCNQNNCLCLKEKDYVCPYLYSDKTDIINDITSEEINLLIKINKLNHADRDSIINIIDALYIREIQKSIF